MSKTINNENSSVPAKITAGQPTKYRPEYCEQLRAHMAEGYSFESFASDLDVDNQTLYNWCAVHPEFKDAKERGVQASRKKIEGFLLETAKGARGNVIAQIFLLKNKFPNEWRDRKEMDFQKIDTESTKSLTLDEQLAKVEAMRAQLLQLKEQQTQAEALTIDAEVK